MENKADFEQRKLSSSHDLKLKLRKLNDGSLFAIENPDDTDTLLVRIRRYEKPQSPIANITIHKSDPIDFDEVIKGSAVEKSARKEDLSIHMEEPNVNSQEHAKSDNGEEHITLLEELPEPGLEIENPAPEVVAQESPTKGFRRSTRTHKPVERMEVSLFPQEKQKQQRLLLSKVERAFIMQTGTNYKKAPKTKTKTQPVPVQAQPQEDEENSRFSIVSEDIEALKQERADYKKACEYFGITHPLVQSHVSFIKHYLKGSITTEESLKDHCVDFLELTKPFKITKGFYIQKLGLPFLTQSKQNIFAGSIVDFYDGFVSQRKYASFLNPGMLVYFYQTVLYIKEISEMVFVVIPEDREDMVLFHTNPVKLLRFVFPKIRDSKPMTSSYRKYKCQKKEFRFGDVCAFSIRKKILSMISTSRNFDELLVKASQSHIAQIPSGNANQLLQNKALIAHDVTELLEEMFRNKISAFSICSKTRFEEFFFGLNNPIVILLHNILRTNEGMTLKDLEKLPLKNWVHLSPFCQLKHLSINLSGGSEDSVRYKYQIERLFPDPSGPSQLLWFVFEITGKKNPGEKDITLTYSIYPTGVYETNGKLGILGRDEKVTGETLRRCFERFLKRFSKVGGWRRIVMDFVDNVLSCELRGLETREIGVEILQKMYKGNNEDMFEKEEEEVEVFEELLEKGKKEKYGLPRIKEKLMECFRSDQDVQLIDDECVITSEKL